MKKLLKIEDGRGYYLDEKDDYVLITELSVDRLKQIIEIVFKEDETIFDAYDDKLVHNAADKIIYNKVATKLKNVQDNREEIISSINSEFATLKTKYVLD
ncbi:MAG: hypothetical protein GX860_11465 [Alcaligenaceae bacterium]|nr:hypothetical protein [Alcaligenaceae bacterium]